MSRESICANLMLYNESLKFFREIFDCYEFTDYTEMYWEYDPDVGDLKFQDDNPYPPFGVFGKSDEEIEEDMDDYDWMYSVEVRSLKEYNGYFMFFVHRCTGDNGYCLFDGTKRRSIE